MLWLRQNERTPAPSLAALEESTLEADERHSPGVAALLEGVGEDRSHAVLDLGAAASSSLRLYSRFARRVRFADVLGDRSSPQGSGAVLGRVQHQPEQPYDLIFAWDVLDRLFPEERPRMIDGLAQVSAMDARLHVVIEASERAVVQPLRFTPLDVDRMRCEPSGPPRPARRRLLPAEIERLLMPFRVVRAFTLKAGLREYVAVRERPYI